MNLCQDSDGYILQSKKSLFQDGRAYEYLNNISWEISNMQNFEDEEKWIKSLAIM